MAATLDRQRQRATLITCSWRTGVTTATEFMAARCDFVIKQYSNVQSSLLLHDRLSQTIVKTIDTMRMRA
jgi:hypothetical protein